MSLPAEASSGPEAGAAPLPLAARAAQATLIPGWRRVRLSEWRWLALILLLFFWRDVPWRLEEYGQARQAFASLEIVRQPGHWWFQHLPGGSQASTQPPLVGWISAGFYYLTGVNWDLAWRLPSLFSGLALLALLWRAGEDLWPSWGGTLAGSAFALNLLTPRLAMLVQTDLPLTLEITLVGWLVWNRVRTGQPWTTGTRWCVFWLMLAALMTQGPMVYAFLLPGLAVHRWISRWRRTAGPLPDVWGGWWHWFLPLLPYLFWLERGAITMPGFYQQVVGHAFPGAAAIGSKAAATEDQPIYFYALQLLLRWLPWSALLLAVRFRAPRVWWHLCGEPATLWLVCWAGGGLLCLSLLPAKRLDRVFPVVPPLCLLLTAALAAARTSPAAPSGAPPPPEVRWPQQWSRWTLWLACALTVLATAREVSLVYRRHDDVLAGFGAHVRALTTPARCELVLAGRHPSAHDEAMLAYLRRLTFLDPAQAIQLNSTDRLASIVLSAPSLASSRGLLSRFHSNQPVLVSGNGGEFVLLFSTTLAAPGAQPGNR